MDDQYRKPEEENETFGPSPAKRDDPYAAARRESEPYTFGPFGSRQSAYGEYGAIAPGGSGELSGQGERPTEVVTSVPPSPPREYRPFTVSGGSSAADWNRKPEKRRRPFLTAFASFMVGVVAVGGLMFAADRGEWFSSQALGGNGGGGSESGIVAASNPVSNAVDVVRPNNIAKIFEQASPAVVKIETFANVRTGNSRGGTDMEDFFRQFFGDDFGGGFEDNDNGSGGSRSDGNLQQSGLGSGFFFDSTGYILTNQHVVADADQIKVLVDGYDEPLVAELLGSDYDLDLAVLKVEGSNFPTLPLGNSSDMNMGDWVVAIGNPYGFDHTVTVGVLSSNEREISIQDTQGVRDYKHLLQTDASINPGNSGGPLLNLQGEVIGINTAVSSQAQGIGFAIPTSTISGVLENLKTNTTIPKEPVPYIGVQLRNLTEAMADQLGLENTEGSIVEIVQFNSPAYKGDMRPYDVILGIDGTKYKNMEALIAAIQKKKVGDSVVLNIIRQGEKMDRTVVIGDKNELEALGNSQR